MLFGILSAECFVVIFTAIEKQIFTKNYHTSVIDGV